MSLAITEALGFAKTPAQIVSRDQAGWRTGPAGSNVARGTRRKIGLAGLLVALAGISLQSRAAYIDSFAVGAQSFFIGAGDASAGGSATGLDTNQVVWGSRSFTIYADQNGSGFRPLDQGSISVTVSGSAPGSCNVQVAESVLQGESDYEPWIYLAYQSDGAAADWSAFDRIVITFTTPPTADMSIQTWAVSDITTWYAQTTAAAGTNSVTILFSNLLASGVLFTGSDVVACSFSFSPPMAESFVIGGIQVTRPAAPPLPCLNAVMSRGGLALTWPTNAAGFALQHTTNLAQSFIAVINNPVVAGTNYSVTLPCACPAEFFCLKRNP
jgi:hypothetical protein